MRTVTTAAPPRLLRTPYSGLDDLLMWMVDPSAADPSAGAWAGLTDLEAAIAVAERLIWARLWAHETWMARGGMDS